MFLTISDASLFQEPDDNANEIDVERLLEEAKHVPSELRQKLIDHVLETVAAAHMDTVTPTRQKVKEANERLANMHKADGPLVSAIFFLSW